MWSSSSSEIGEASGSIATLLWRHKACSDKHGPNEECLHLFR